MLMSLCHVCVLVFCYLIAFKPESCIKSTSKHLKLNLYQQRFFPVATNVIHLFVCMRSTLTLSLLEYYISLLFPHLKSLYCAESNVR